MGSVTMPTVEQALPGREQPIIVGELHSILSQSIMPPFPLETEQILLGMGCFWGAERLFWSQPGVYVTAVGYAGGFTHNPIYREVCSGLTGHSEVVKVVFDPQKISLAQILVLFWQNHDPTQGMRQGNDIGTQYRSAIYCQDERQLQQARESLQCYQAQLNQRGYGDITTEVALQTSFYYAEKEHQQYLAKNPMGYCGLSGCGVDYPQQ